MRHEAKLEMSSGMVMDEATLVVVRPVGGGQRRREAEDHRGDAGLVAEAFGEEVCGGCGKIAEKQELHSGNELILMVTKSFRFSVLNYSSASSEQNLHYQNL